MKLMNRALFKMTILRFFQGPGYNMMDDGFGALTSNDPKRRHLA